jgi:hypothetical protein
MCALLAIGAWSNLSRKLSAMGGGIISITSRTSKNTFEVLKEDPCTFSNYVEVQATWMFFQVH